MGAGGSSNVARKGPDEILANFLHGDIKEEELWKEFDSDGNGAIDMSELDGIIHVSLNYFVKLRNPRASKMSEDTTAPFVKSIRAMMTKEFDNNQDDVIDRREFTNLANYLMREHEQVLREVDEAKRKALEAEKNEIEEDLESGSKERTQTSEVQEIIA